WKYEGDYVIGESIKTKFTASFMSHFQKRDQGHVIVPIPLSKSRLYVRGFNQALTLATFLKKAPEECLIRLHSEKQAKKSKYERMMSRNPFQLTKKVTKPVILIDDLYTTGRTLRHA